MNTIPKQIWDLLQRLVENAMRHDILTLSAALAFYTTFSLAPLLLILVSLIGMVGLDQQIELIAQIRQVLGQQAADGVALVMQNTDKNPSFNTLAGVFGAGVLLFSASVVFGQLQSSLNIIWEVPSNPQQSEIWQWFKKRVFSMGLVVTFVLMSLVSLIVNALLAGAFAESSQFFSWVNLVASVLIFTFLFSIIFQYLPDERVSVRQAWGGGFLTALLFTLGKHFIGLYLGHSGVGSAYGTAGSLVVLLVWVYYSSVIIFLGAEFTHAVDKKILLSNRALRPVLKKVFKQ